MMLLLPYADAAPAIASKCNALPFPASRRLQLTSRRAWLRVLSSSMPDQVYSKPSPECLFIKRKVAMWIGYVGTDYKGLQIQRTKTDHTIEEELERAIFRARGITESNFGKLEKVGWMRSSRTDKGVHSLSTVISFKMEVELDAWRKDDHGIAIADKINSYLPRGIQVFGFEFVNQSFEPRRHCCSRVYHYLFPAKVLGITENSDTEDFQQIILTFQRILSSLEGRHPYHNYTVRSNYRKNSKNLSPTTQKAHKEEQINIFQPNSDDDESGGDEDSLLGIVESLEVTDDKGIVSSSLSSPPKIRWLYEHDPSDRIFQAHFRRVYSITCGEVENLDGVHFIKLKIHGESFMLHQIRKMVGTGIAVMRQVLPSDIIPVSLSRPCRVVLPLAPSEGLLLASNEFYPFRGNFKLPGGKEPEEVSRLTMPEKVLKRKEHFWSTVLLPEMITLLRDSSTWDTWLENLELGRISEAELDPVRIAWKDWISEVGEKRRASEKPEHTGMV